MFKMLFGMIYLTNEEVDALHDADTAFEVLLDDLFDAASNVVTFFS